MSTDRGQTWKNAELNDPILPKALTRFRLPWTWNGEETYLQSRCSDETGYLQPTRDELIAIRGNRPGPDGFDHFNGVKEWRVHSNGEVTHV